MLSPIDESTNDTNQFRNLKIYICTWNVNTKSPKFKLNDLVTFDADNQPHVCVFGFQEVNSKPLQRLWDYFYNDPWTNLLTDLLSESDYVRIISTRLVGNLLNVFVKRDIIAYVNFCTEDWIRLGFQGYWGNKGANYGLLKIGQLNIAFVNTHLSAHAEYHKTRLIEHEKIVYHKVKTSENNTLETIFDQKYLFLFGDLNFRTEDIDFELVKELIKNDQHDKLLNYDQLKKCIKNEKCFSIFDEDHIKFAPSYKFKVNTDIYDLSKKNRMPSWCDRILYKKSNTTGESCTPLAYDTLRKFNQSDHKPVYGLFEVSVKDWEKEPARIIFNDVSPSEEQDLIVSYRVHKCFTFNANDWIGIFDKKFTSINDYLTYVWAPKINQKVKSDESTKNLIENDANDEEENYIQMKVKFDQYYLQTGSYVLGYFSHKSNNLIALSDRFELNLD